jgi:Fic family protein
MDPKNFSNKAPRRVIYTPNGCWAFMPDPLPPTIQWSGELLNALSEAERQLGYLASLADTLPSPFILIQPFIRREAVLSSRIEGTRASLEDLYHFEARQLSFLEDSSDVREVQNYRKALNYGLERLCSLPISLRLIREIHGKLMEGVRGEYLTPGEFRSSQNWIGPAGSAINSATLVPPPVDEMHTALAELENFIHSASDLPKLVQAGLIQYQFETIHPFLDGNGRLGRLLVTLLLIEWGLISQPLLYLSAFFETHRLEYYDNLLAVSQLGDWERWLRFFLRGVSSQSMDATRRIECLGKLRTCYRELLSNERAGVRLLEALDALFERPILTIHQLESALGVPFISARRYMEKLVEKGIVREITGHTRNRLYQADDILKALMSTQ